MQLPFASSGESQLPVLKWGSALGPLAAGRTCQLRLL